MAAVTVLKCDGCKSLGSWTGEVRSFVLGPRNAEIGEVDLCSDCVERALQHFFFALVTEQAGLWCNWISLGLPDVEAEHVA